MIDSEIVMGTGLRITVAKDELAAKLALVARGVSTRTAVLVLGGIQLRAEEGSSTSPRPTWRSRCARPLEAQVSGEGDDRRARAGCCSTSRARCPTARSRSSTAPRRRPSSSPPARRATACTRTRPRTSRGCRTSTRGVLHTVDRDALIETVARVGRSASRDESRPVLTGILVRFEPGKIVMAATDSYRLAVKETTVEGELPELEAIIPARALQELARIASALGRPAARHAGQPRRLRLRRHLADDAPHRRSVPERTASCCRSSSSRSSRCRAKRCSRSCAASR